MSAPRSWILIGAVIFASCSNDGPPGNGNNNGGDAGSGTADSGGSNNNRIDAGVRAWASLRIAPADAVIAADNGAMATQTFELFATDTAGVEMKIEGGVNWRAADDRIGTFATESVPVFTSSGIKPGTTEISAFFAGLSARTNITVRFTSSRVEGGAPVDAASRFGGPRGADPASAPAIIYPANEVVIPKNLFPMVLQWDGPAALDVFRTRVAGPGVEVTLFTAARQGSLGAEEWANLLESAAGSSFEIEVSAISSADPTATVHVSLPLRVRVADGQMRGTIYYWALNIGRILRIRPGAGNAEDFFTPPPKDGTNNTCAGCHTLSRDGRKMAFEYYGGWESHGVIDVSAPATPLIGPGVFGANFSAFSSDGTRLLGSLNGVLSLWDASTGAGLETLNTGVLVSHPAWSPDGRTVAYVSQVAGQSFSDVDFFQSDLTVIRNFDGARSAPETLFASGGAANTYPSFSPDSRWVAFTRGPYSRSHTNYDPAAPSALSPADIYMISTDGGAPLQLAAASGGGQALLPAFSPFESGGYYWLAFFSRRNYGHITAGSARRQIWVTAIDANTGAADPSHPAFWLPGQDSSTENMSAYWAPDPCHATGDLCTLDEDCCQPIDGGEPVLCRPQGNGERRCVSRENACRDEGEPCAGNGECCTHLPLQCIPTADVPRCQRVDL